MSEPDASPDAFTPPVDIDGAELDASEILVVRRGPGANCSSIGSVLDVLFLSAAFGGALLVAVAASMGDGREPPPRARAAPAPPPDDDEEPDARAR